MNSLIILYSFETTKHINLYFLIKLLNSIFINCYVIEYSQYFTIKHLTKFKNITNKILSFLASDLNLTKLIKKNLLNDHVLVIFIDIDNIDELNTFFKNKGKQKFIEFFKISEIVNSKKINNCNYKYFFVQNSFNPIYSLNVNNKHLLESYLWYKSIYLIEKLSSRKLTLKVYNIELNYLKKIEKKIIVESDSLYSIKEFPIFFFRHASILNSIFYTPFIFISSKLWKKRNLFKLINLIRLRLNQFPAYLNNWYKLTKNVQRRMLEFIPVILNYIGLKLFKTRFFYKKFSEKKSKFFSNFDVLLLFDKIYFRLFDKQNISQKNFLKYKKLLECYNFTNKQLLKRKKEIKQITNICKTILNKKIYFMFKKKILILIKGENNCYSFYLQVFEMLSLCFKKEYNSFQSFSVLVKCEQYSIIILSLINFKNIVEIKDFEDNFNLSCFNLEYFIIKKTLLIKTRKKLELIILQKIGINL